MAIAFTAVAASAAVAFAFAVRRGRREWEHADRLTRASAALITATWALAAAALIVALVWRPMGPEEVSPAVLAPGVVLVVAGLALALPGYLPFASLKHLYGLDRGGLITGGVFRYSRNPQYTGIGLVFVGAAAVGASPLALMVAVAYWLAIAVWVRIEETHLHHTFGAAYAAYCGQVPRFLGRV